jgi:hypothetical protein
VFFGFESDTTLASYLYSLINHAMWTELESFRAAHPQLRATGLRSASKSFQQGMAVRIAGRLDHMHHARDANVAAQRSTGTALMVIKHRVVDDAFRETEIRLVSAGSLTRARVNGAFRHGMAAGDRVNLNRPVQALGTSCCHDRGPGSPARPRLCLGGALCCIPRFEFHRVRASARRSGRDLG